MKPIVIFVVSCVTLGLSAQSSKADQFQIIDRDTNAAVRYVRITVQGQDFYTDQYGRVSIEGLPRGAYNARVGYGERDISVTIEIRDSEYLEPIYVSRN